MLDCESATVCTGLTKRVPVSTGSDGWEKYESGAKTTDRETVHRKDPLFRILRKVPVGKPPGCMAT
jgi:hypothetical protein